jgi:Domain of unknown function (DUF4340)
VRRYIGIIALVVVFAVLLIIVLVTAPRANAPATAQATPTLTADQLKLNIITLPTGEQPSKLVISQTTPPKAITLIYEGAAWKLENQPQTPLDSSQTGGTIGLLTQYKGTQVVNENPTEANLTEFGLATPSYKFDLTSPSGTRSLLIGNVNTVTNVYYLKLADKPTVWTVPPSLINTLKGWLEAPPLAPPTPTPVPTLPVTATLDPATVATATANAALTPTAGATPTVGATTAPAATTAVAATTAPPTATPTLAGTATPRP